eukprot:CAMPEP_0182437124 /NCGR_PEP_ID=MMETSP1167-20130531/84829_1 /TAXON_ID=2988 /ORGANISM="Mallomonas Sp, Strain CCMP3275" /LENGTH=458 /DNA_ID=CAMNT_0024629921 /DNA_START=50 /DNA_END=1426 /DNA_ORIENTATION=+
MDLKIDSSITSQCYPLLLNENKINKSSQNEGSLTEVKNVSSVNGGIPVQERTDNKNFNADEMEETRKRKRCEIENMRQLLNKLRGEKDKLQTQSSSDSSVADILVNLSCDGKSETSDICEDESTLSGKRIDDSIGSTDFLTLENVMKNVINSINAVDTSKIESPNKSEIKLSAEEMELRRREKNRLHAKETRLRKKKMIKQMEKNMTKLEDEVKALRAIGPSLDSRNGMVFAINNKQNSILNSPSNKRALSSSSSSMSSSDDASSEILPSTAFPMQMPMNMNMNMPMSMQMNDGYHNQMMYPGMRQPYGLDMMQMGMRGSFPQQNMYPGMQYMQPQNMGQPYHMMSMMSPQMQSQMTPQQLNQPSVMQMPMQMMNQQQYPMMMYGMNKQVPSMGSYNMGLASGASCETEVSRPVQNEKYEVYEDNEFSSKPTNELLSEPSSSTMKNSVACTDNSDSDK